MASILKVNELQHTGGTSAATINSSGLVLPKIPCFEVIKNSSQALTASTWTKITFNAESYDTAGHFDLANSKFQPDIAGVYQINLCLYFGSGSNTAALSTLRKNGSQIRKMAYLYHTDQSLDDYGISGSTMVQMNGSSDYIEAWAWGLGTNQTVNGGSLGEETIISGHLVSVL